MPQLKNQKILVASLHLNTGLFKISYQSNHTCILLQLCNFQSLIIILNDFLNTQILQIHIIVLTNLVSFLFSVSAVAYPRVEGSRFLGF